MAGEGEWSVGDTKEVGEGRMGVKIWTSTCSQVHISIVYSPVETQLKDKFPEIYHNFLELKKATVSVFRCPRKFTINNIKLLCFYKLFTAQEWGLRLNKYVGLCERAKKKVAFSNHKINIFLYVFSIFLNYLEFIFRKLSWNDQTLGNFLQSGNTGTVCRPLHKDH